MTNPVAPRPLTAPELLAQVEAACGPARDARHAARRARLAAQVAARPTAPPRVQAPAPGPLSLGWVARFAWALVSTGDR